jgi:hypothetical protein
MNRRALLIWIASLTLTTALPGAGTAFAKDGEDDDDGDSNSGSSNSGSGGGDDDDDSDEDDDGGDDVGEDGPDDNDHDDARDAVSQKGAIPLDEMLERVKRYGAVTIIDVKLLMRHGSLQYRFKIVDKAGRVKNAFFDALTGEPA